MNVRVLIDAIVHQTMVLIAQLATTAGIRAPLAHLANQVFLDLVSELHDQGVSRKVAADMFGMALRSYQQKVQRLSESATVRGVTLWQAIYNYLQEHEVVTRADVLRRFSRDDVASVRGILNDMVETNMVYRSGRGDATIYRVMAEDDISRAMIVDQEAGKSSLVWGTIYREGPLTRAALEALGVDEIDGVLEALVDEGRVRVDGAGAYTCEQFVIPLEDEAGWGAALFDHYQSVVTAMVVKLRNGTTRAFPDDRLGGSTFSFDIWEGHPHEEEVYALLSSMRSEIVPLWHEVREHNRVAQRPEGASRVTFYVGQTIQADAVEEESP